MPMLTDRYDQALVYASQLHRTQIRKGSGVPYVAHLISVSALALEHGADEDEAIAALLHDAIEDCGAEVRGPIQERFGARVLAIVEGCTDAEEQPKPAWLSRKQTYLTHLPEADRSVLLVSASDKLHNMRSILTDLRTVGDEVWSRFKAGKPGSLWYYRSLVESYRRSGKVPAALLAELEEAVATLETRVAHRAAPHPAVPEGLPPAALVAG
ncbi:MAG: metal dependent phosphohydrolase [Cyanobacteria bacterium RYN_339]|nr:metal dependent phosphohydrolase [Cyanobacteria bacterium RYN_339]